MLKKVWKAVLILIGGLLVLGGGLCAASNVYFTLADPSLILLTGILLAICVAAIWGGWAILKVAGVVGAEEQQPNIDEK